MAALLDDALDAAVAASREMLGIAVLTLNLTGIDLKMTEYRVLVCLLIRGARHPSEIAANLGVSNATISRATVNLERLGLVDRYPDPDSARRMLVALSDKGHAVSGEAMARRRGIFASVLKDMTPDELSIARRVLNGFADAAWCHKSQQV